MLKTFLKENRSWILLSAAVILLNLGTFWLYRMEMEPFIYGTVLSGVVCVLVIGLRFRKFVDGCRKREQGISSVKPDAPDVFGLNLEVFLGEEGSRVEKDYREMLRCLRNRALQQEQQFLEEREDMEDYYTKWVHQIKTPISVMRLALREEDTPENRRLLSELFQIEQYVEMVLHYIRLDSSGNDLMIQEYALDDLIRESIRKFSSLFINRNVRLEYRKVEGVRVTDKKYFACVFEQILSNAIKYTDTYVRIEADDRGRIRIEDDGPGIEASDIPRIFEKGYTGCNGRQEMKSSGLGLYLCSRAAKKISVEIDVDSEPGRGTVFSLKLPEQIKILD